MDKRGDLIGRMEAMDDFHAKFSLLTSREELEEAIEWLRSYRESNDGNLDENALQWLNRTIKHIEERL